MRSLANKKKSIEEIYNVYDHSEMASSVHTYFDTLQDFRATDPLLRLFLKGHRTSQPKVHFFPIKNDEKKSKAHSSTYQLTKCL